MTICDTCEVCGSTRGLDRHHVEPRRMGGSNAPAVNDEANLMRLCRGCHRKFHEGRWELERSAEGIRVFDKATGEPVMRRLSSQGFDTPKLFQVLNVAEDSLSGLLKGLPYLTDEELAEAFAYASSFGKRAWLLQAAILYEAQKRSTYGEHTLEAIARRFEIGLRQAQKYALVWKLFFAQTGEEENVNIDAIALDEPSWYVIAATETKDPETWLGYAQDRKATDPGYSVAAFRRDIFVARFNQGVGDAKEAREGVDLPSLRNSWTCPWVKLLCVRPGKPVPYRECDCEFKEERWAPVSKREAAS